MYKCIFIHTHISPLCHKSAAADCLAEDVGFTCYTLFCWGSTISSLGVHLPALNEEMKAASKEPWPLRVFGRKGTSI